MVVLKVRHLVMALAQMAALVAVLHIKRRQESLAALETHQMFRHHKAIMVVAQMVPRLAHLLLLEVVAVLEPLGKL